MNVALTRAKFACYVIGNEQTLRSSRPWGALIAHAQKKKCFVQVPHPHYDLFSLVPALKRNSNHHGSNRHNYPDNRNGGGGQKRRFMSDRNQWRGRGRSSKRGRYQDSNHFEYRR